MAKRYTARIIIAGITTVAILGAATWDAVAQQQERDVNGAESKQGQMMHWCVATRPKDSALPALRGEAVVV